MVKKNTKLIIAIIAVILIIRFVPSNFLGIVGDFCEGDRSCCEPTDLNFVCFRNDAQTIQSPVSNEMLQNRLLGGSREFLENDKGMVAMHYRGSRIQIRPGDNAYTPGVGGLAFSSYGTIFAPAMQIVGASFGTLYEWRPDRMAGYGQSSSPTHFIQSETETYPIDKYTFMTRFKLKCGAAAGCNVIGAMPYIRTNPSGSLENITFSTNIGGYNGFDIYVDKSSSRDENLDSHFYIVVSEVITQFDEAQGRLYLPLALNEEKEYIAIFTTEEGLVNIPSYMSNPDQAISNAQTDVQSYLRMFKFPSAATEEQKHRYYQGIWNSWYNLMSAHDSKPSIWGTHEIIKPGVGYDGIWMWDSFFAAWMFAAACDTGACYDIPREWFRVFIENAGASGRFPREIWNNFVGSGWQAPGGWPFAVWQLHQQSPDAAYLCEVYPGLKANHEWILNNQDGDGDSLFQWGGTNSGWDSSARWVQQEVEALDLQGWMILGAESMKNIAAVCEPSEVALWDTRLTNYRAASDKMWQNGMYWDIIPGTDVATTKISPAMYVLMMSGTTTEARDSAMVSLLHDTTKLGKDPVNNIGLIPTLARDDPDFHNEDDTSISWSGRVWGNINLITWLGLKRKELDSDADYVKEGTFEVMDIGQIGYESYFSTTGLKGTNNFGGWPFLWSDAAYVIMMQDWSPDWDTVVDPCSSETCGNDFCSTSCGETEVSCPQDCVTACVPTETPETTCDDGLDNDCDSLIDSLDLDCQLGATIDIVCIGDSNTKRVSLDEPITTGYCNRLRIDNNFIETTYNRGIDGITTYNLIQNCYSSNPGCIDMIIGENLNADWAVIMIGTNDLFVGVGDVDSTSIEEYYSFLTQSVVDLKNDGLNVLLSTIPPCNAATHQCGNNDQTNVIQRNDVVRRVSDEQNVVYADIFSDVFSGTTTHELFKWDGVHIHLESEEGITCDYVKGNAIQDCGHLTMAELYATSIQSGTPYNCNANPGTCYQSSACTITETPETTCDDGLDNDCDGLIDSSDSDCPGGTCTDGEQRACSGTSRGECTLEIETCSGGTWSGCSSVQTAEICDGRDNDCDGIIDNGISCNFRVTISKDDWITKYDSQNLAFRNGCLPCDATSPGYWRWDAWPIVRADRDMYTVTKDTKYIDLMITNADAVIGKATLTDGFLNWRAMDNDMAGDMWWEAQIFLIPSYVIGIVYDSELKNNPTYKAKADEYIIFVQNFITYYKTTTTPYTWREWGDQGVYSYDDGNIESSRPHNQYANIATVFLNLYKATGNQDYLNKVTRMGNYLKASLMLETGCDHTSYEDCPTTLGCNPVTYETCPQVDNIRWLYHDETGEDWDFDFPEGEWMDNGPEDLSHSDVELSFMIDMFEEGLVFTDSNFRLIKNLFVTQMWNYEVDDPRFNMYLEYATPYYGPSWPNPRPNNIWSTTPAIETWCWLGKYDSNIIGFCEKILDNVVGTTFSDFYECYTDEDPLIGNKCGTTSFPATPSAVTQGISSMLLAAEDAPVSEPSDTSSGGGGLPQNRLNCINANGEWDFTNLVCICPSPLSWDTDSEMCEEQPVEPPIEETNNFIYLLIIGIVIFIMSKRKKKK